MAHARWQLEYAFHRAMSDEDIAAALTHQRRVDAGQFVMDEFDRTQVAALRQWQRVAGERRRE